MPIRLWSATHANNWETWIADAADGTFAGWACPADEDATNVRAYIEDTFDHAASAALFALAERSGHQSCTSSCGAWQEREPLPIADHANHLPKSDRLPTLPASGGVMEKTAKKKTSRTTTHKVSKRKTAVRKTPKRTSAAKRARKAKRKVKLGQRDKADH